MSKRIVEITGIRCFAVMMVTLSHAQHTIEGGYTGFLSPLWLFSHGSQSVLLSFVLSGFLITRMLTKEFAEKGCLDLIAFYSKRILRIWPASYFYILTIAALSMAGILAIDWRHIAIASLHLWNYGELLHVTVAEGTHGNWYLGHLWTLALEEQFYWVWPPILLYILRNRSERLLLALIFIVPLIRMASYFLVPSLRGQVNLMLHSGVDPILVGCYLAMNQEKWSSKLAVLKYRHWILTGVVIVFMIATPQLGIYLKGIWTATYGRTIDALLAAIIILSMVEVKDFWLARICRMRLVVFVGTISYSIYLWQQLFLGEYFKYALKFPFNIVQALVMALISYYMVEKSFLRRSKPAVPDKVVLQN